jgi:putative copper resistance protein D
MAGFCLIVAGGLILAQDRLARRWPAARYIWPCGLLFPGVYLLFLSDTEIWPFGDQNLFTLLATDAEVLQHKLFVLILLVLGTIELERVRGRLTGTWSAFVFPVLAFGGAVMLLFHPHGMEEHTPQHMAVMQHIQAQHIRFAVVGMLIAVSKALAEIRWVRRQLFVRAWPSFMMLLGVLLLIYRE